MCAPIRRFIVRPNHEMEHRDHALSATNRRRIRLSADNNMHIAIAEGLRYKKKTTFQTEYSAGQRSGCSRLIVPVPMKEIVSNRSSTLRYDHSVDPSLPKFRQRRLILNLKSKLSSDEDLNSGFGVSGFRLTDVGGNGHLLPSFSRQAPRSRRREAERRKFK